MAAVGFGRYLFGSLPDAPTADLTIQPESEYLRATGLALAFLLLRAFASGRATLTGVEAIANGVPAFRKPKGKNAATTLLILGVVAVTGALSIITLANLTHARIARTRRRS